MSGLQHLYLFISQGVGWLGLMLYLGGFAVCLSYRRLSPMLIVASVGFAGEAASGTIARFAQFAFPAAQESLFLCYLIASILGLVSTLLLIFGLATALADIRRQLALALEPTHVRK